MSEHRVTLTWKRSNVDFTYESYNRDHTWAFEGGQQVRASAAVDYHGDAALVNPEEAFVASLSSCHMLTFLAIAARKRLAVDRYTDQAVGFLEKNNDGKIAVTRVVLRPKISYGGDTQPTAEMIDDLHHQAHRHCFIANSVQTSVSIETV